MAKNRIRKVQRSRPVFHWPAASFLAGLLGCLAVLMGRFEPEFWDTPLSLAVAGLVLVFFALSVNRLPEKATPDLSVEYGGLCLLACGLIWIFFRVGSGFAPQAILLPALFSAWLVAALPLPLMLLALAAMILMEAGLWLGGYQPLTALAGNLAACAAAALGLRFFMAGKNRRNRIGKEPALAEKKEAGQECARDLGLDSVPPGLPSAVSGPGPSPDTAEGDKSAAENVEAGFAAQLALVRQALNVTTAALLWPDAAGKEYRLRGIASIRPDIAPGPYPVGSGITGVLLKAGDTVGIAPVPPSFGGLPYYKEQKDVGAILAVRLRESDGDRAGEDGGKIPPILCVDRTDPGPWTEEEKISLALAAQKLVLDVAAERRFQVLAREHDAVQQVCSALRELNAVADLDQVLESTARAVRFLAHVDFIAVSLVQEHHHKIALAEGPGAEKLLGREFPREEGLVGRVLSLNRPLPANARCHGAMQVFGREHLLAGYASLLVVPLQKEEGTAVGTLTVAAGEPGVFNPARQEILRLIAAQVAVKIDLGQTHQQLNRLATTDGLTGLLNHRTFQHGFDMMLQREGRRQGSLSLLLCDIDHFKKINDSYGHPFGDKVLRDVAGVLGKAARRIDLAARYGGEEFALLLEGAGEKGALKVAARIRKEIEEMVFRHEQGPVRVTISVGLAISPDHGTDKALLIGRADQALYQAKEQGRNRVVVWGAA